MEDSVTAAKAAASGAPEVMLPIRII